MTLEGIRSVLWDSFSMVDVSRAKHYLRHWELRPEKNQIFCEITWSRRETNVYELGYLLSCTKCSFKSWG